MALDFDAWQTPVSADSPCGPDLNTGGDTDYLLYRAQVEGLLPGSYFSFDPKSIDIKSELAGANRLLERSRDLEIMVLVERLLALDQDLDGFVAALGAITDVLETSWDEVHPQAVEGDFTMRAVPLTTLDDRPTIVLPLQHLALLQVERIGRLSYRDHLIASGELSPREGEAADPDRVRKILHTADLDEMIRVRGRLAEGVAHLERIRTIFVERAGYEQAVKLTTLPGLLSGMEAFLDGAIKERDPSLAGDSAPAGEDDPKAAAGDGQAAPVRLQGAVVSHEDARRALATASRYFVRSEPASASRLLIHQARQLMGLSFAEMLAALAPSVASDAAISIPGRRPIRLELERLGDRLSSEADAIARDCPDDDENAGAAQASEAMSSEGDAVEAASSSDPVSAPTPNADRPSFRAASRAEAIALLDAVSAWYRVSEPASPIPILLDKARDLANRDFASLLQDMTEDEGT